MTSSESERPAWINEQLFPFASRFTEIDANRLHYVDEGSGPTILMLHGNPTWSFLYRHLITGLRADFRCVAVDYPGFGMSHAAPGYRFVPSDHSDVIAGFVEELDLVDVTLMVQDWGGPIGFGAAVQNPDRYSRFIVGNTWGWPVSGDKSFERFSKLVGGPVGKALIRQFNFFVNVLIPAGHKNNKLSKEEMRHYKAPFPTPDTRVPTWIFPHEIIASADFLASVEAGLDQFADRKALIVWADRDLAFKEKERRRWEALFPDHVTRILHGAGHYLQDDAPDEVIEAIRAWLPGS